MRRIKTAIHLHTNFSFDSNLSPRDIVASAQREGIDCVAITDHDAVEGAFAVLRIGGVRVVIGEEISSRDGHIIGLFLREWIPPAMSAAETIDAIRAQDGVVLAPHPFATLCDESLGRAVEELADRIDAVEIHNAQNPLPWQDRRAAEFARRHGLRVYAGSDGHIRGRIAPAFQIMPDFHDAASFLASLEQAELVAGRFGPLYLSQMIARHLWDAVMPNHLPGFGVNHQPPASGTNRAVITSFGNH